MILSEMEVERLQEDIAHAKRVIRYQNSEIERLSEFVDLLYRILNRSKAKRKWQKKNTGLTKRNKVKHQTIPIEI